MGMQLAYVGMFSLWEDCFRPYLSQTNPSVYVLSSVVILEYFFFKAGYCFGCLRERVTLSFSAGMSHQWPLTSGNFRLCIVFAVLLSVPKSRIRCLLKMAI